MQAESRHFGSIRELELDGLLCALRPNHVGQVGIEETRIAPRRAKRKEGRADARNDRLGRHFEDEIAAEVAHRHERAAILLDSLQRS